MRAARWKRALVFGVALVLARCGQTTPGNPDAATTSGGCPERIVYATSCSESGLTCPAPNGTSCSSFSFWACDGKQFIHHDVGPGVPCTQAGLDCRWPGTECDSCICDGTQFVCHENCCTTDCDAGPPPTCPSPDAIIEGDSCTGSLMCPATSYPCDAGSTAECTCAAASVWQCQCVATPVKLASGHPSGIAADGAYVYWTDTDGTVKKLAVGGTTPEVIATGQLAPGAITVDATSAYWTNVSATGNVTKVALGGGTPVVLASNQNYADTIAVDATNVYWGAYENVMKVPISGGSPTVLTARPQPIFDIAIDASYVYWTEAGDVLKVTLAGGKPVTVAAAGVPGPIAVDATSVYWSDYTLVSMTLIGGKSTTLASARANDIALDASFVYWVDVYGGSVMKVAKTGGPPVVLAYGQSFPAAIAVDDMNVYWVVTDAVMTTPK